MRRRVGIILVIVGIVCVLGGAGLFIYDRIEAQMADDAANEVLDQLHDAMPVRIYPENGEMPTITIDGYEYIGTLEIPRFDLELPVQDQWSYEGFRVAPGRYAGSVWTSDMVIAAHNYDRHFGHLQELEAGDTVVFTDVLGNVFTYTVDEVDTLEPTAVEEMTSGDWDLTLFTCTLGGMTRVTVRCSETH